MNEKTILTIETSCDETAIALVRAKRTAHSAHEVPEFEILAEHVSSQIDIHRPFGGVVPSLAKREHLKNLPVVYEQVLQSAQGKAQSVCHSGRFALSDLPVDCIAVTVGPGLEPALWTGINFAKELAEKCGVPLVGVNHLEGHVYSNWLPNNIRKNNIRKSDFNRKSDFQNIKFPAIVLIVSGGHTILLYMESMKKWTKLGETQDDAAGEAFDKVAKMLGLPYPGGPEVERLALQSAKRKAPVETQTIASKQSTHNNARFALSDLPVFPRPMLHSGDYNFSFSGLKTAVLYYIREQSAQRLAHSVHNDLRLALSDLLVTQVCASFQEAAIEVLVKKTMHAAEEYEAQSILLCGGVASNRALQAEFRFRIQDSGIQLYVPELRYNTDNAVMIAAAAYLGNHYPTEKALPNLGL